MNCDTCGDMYKEKNRPIEDMRISAKLLAGEKGQAQAICKEDSTGQIFSVNIADALNLHFHILEVVSGLPD